MTPRLDMRRIEKRFGGVRALDGADFSALAGEIHGLCGENGAGKSTLLKVLSGVYPHGSYGGEVLLDGRELRLRSTAQARAAGVGIVHQELMLVPEMSVAANLYLGREPSRLGLVDDLALEAQARRLLQRFGLDGEIDVRAPVGTLGIGKQQMVEIARALSDEVRVLVLDEPTAALASDETARLMAWLRDLAARGTTCVYVSHRMDEVFALCDRVTVLRDGRTVDTLTVAQTSPKKIVSLMVGRDLPASVNANVNANVNASAGLTVDSLTVGNVLRDLSFTVGAGEIVAVAGAMGSGRTALLSTLFGCARARVSGRVRFAGETLPLDSAARAIGAGVALVPEDRKGRGLVLGLTVEENLALPSLSRGGLFGFVDDLALEREAAARIGELKVRGDAESPAATLSGGNQQKVVLGKWLANPPRLLLLDEPTRGVDVGAREEIYALLEALAARGVAILFASSDLPEVVRLAHRTLVLRKGALVATLPAGAREAQIVELTTGALAPSTSNGGEKCA
jgi:ABC-type sugar transport system ATPase subunit